MQNSWYYGFAGMDLKFFYDPAVFELVSAKATGELGDALCSIHTGTEGLVRMTCASTWQIWCCDLLELELRVRESASGSTWLTAEVSDIYDESRIPYQPGSVNAQFTVMPAQEDPVCGLRLEYDPAVVECLSVGSAAEDAYLIINPNFSDGVIRFSYVKESGTSDETPLVTIRWKPRTGANSHFTLKTTLIDPVDRDHGRVEIDCPVYSSCIYLTETTTATCTQPGGTCQLCLGCGSRIPLDTVPALGHNFENGTCTECGEKAPVVNNPFVDVPEGIFLEPVLWAVEKGITTGIGNNLFDVLGVCNRVRSSPSCTA